VRRGGGGRREGSDKKATALGTELPIDSQSSLFPLHKSIIMEEFQIAGRTCLRQNRMRGIHCGDSITCIGSRDQEGGG
jgi:hypothetical protein